MLTGKLSTLQNEVDELRGKLISAQSETLSRDLDLKQVCLEVLCRCEQLIRRHTSAFNKTVSYQRFYYKSNNETKSNDSHIMVYFIIIDTKVQRNAKTLEDSVEDIHDRYRRRSEECDR